MGWLDWKVRDVLAGLGAAALVLAAFVGGNAFSYRLLTMLGAPPPDDFDGTVLGTVVAGYSGLALAYIFFVQVRARRPPRGLPYALVITTASIAAASVLQALGNWIANEFISLAVCVPLALLGQTLIVMAWMNWLERNPWVKDELTGRNARAAYFAEVHGEKPGLDKNSR